MIKIESNDTFSVIINYVSQTFDLKYIYEFYED